MQSQDGLAKKKIVYFYHQRGNLDPTHFGKNRFFKEIFIRLIEGRILRRANRLIALTQHERDIFEQWAPGQAVSVLPNGVNFDLWQIPVPVEKALPNLSFLRDDLPILLWFSRYNKFKNPDLFIDLVASLKVRGHEFHAVMAGSDEDNLRSHCERRAKNEGLGSILTVLPELRDESRQAILQRCDIFVLPTHGEGFSMSILEAMAASCVIITSTGANFPELATELAGCVLPLKLDEFVHNTEKMLLNPKIRKGMICNARKLVSRLYDWDNIATMYENLAHVEIEKLNNRNNNYKG